jgi:hypothetical protein
VKRAAAAIRRLVLSVSNGIGIEGLFLLAGTCALAVASSYISAAGPWFVVGAVSLLAGIALALPSRKG